MAATATPLAIALPSLGPTIGAAYVGAMMAAILYGATNVQTYLYLKNYPNDWLLQRYAVVLLWVLDSLHMVFTITPLWHYLIESFGNYLALLKIDWSLKVQIAVNVIIILFVQSLYTVRVWKLSSNNTRIWAWVLIVVLLAGYATGIILIVKTITISYFSQLNESRWVIYLAFAMPTFNDIVLAAGIWHLLSLRRTTFAETQSKIWIILRYVFISGALTSVCSLSALITYVVMPNNLVFLGIEFLLTKLYINSYLAMLNARKSVKDHTTLSHTANVMQLSDLESRQPDLDYHGSSRSTDDGHGKFRNSMHTSNRNSKAVRIRVDVDRVRRESDYTGLSDISPRSSPHTPAYDEKDDQEFVVKEAVRDYGYAV
ncbi:hypothetical protein F5887DRAFT_957456 [Amanita rubescens]|nr:hypothetical protein F5887DRAFT_957456 [Amanita rubescens]